MNTNTTSLPSLGTTGINSIPTSIFQFAFCRRIDRRDPSKNKTFEDFIEELYDLTSTENWGDSLTKKHPILHNYIHHTFQKLSGDYNKNTSPADRDKIICIKNNHACFNTGLFTDRYESIYCLFEKNRLPNKQPWYLIGFAKESDVALSRFSCLPERAQYFSDPRELIFDYRMQIRPNKDHILGDAENIKRLPTHFQDPAQSSMLYRLFDGTVQQAEKQISANYKLAVPQYYNGNIQLLIPLSLDSDKPQLALAIQRDGQVYTARTCLTLEMAYNNARLIVRPEVNWLEPKAL